MTNRTRVYVALPDEAVDVWRPVEAEQVDEGLFLIVDDAYDSGVETWESEPGTVVRVEHRLLEGVQQLVAVSRV